MKTAWSWPSASMAVALGSMVSLAAQVVFSLLMLRLFAPAAVGAFSVISQMAFFWMTLALAQSPIKFLADVHLEPRLAIRQALHASAVRLLLLAPLVVGVLWLGNVAQAAQVWLWAVLLAVLQMGWYLAQPLTLRLGSSLSTAWVRALPPVVALATAALVGRCWPHMGSLGLLAAAAAGYAVGALWLWPAFTNAHGSDQAGVPVQSPTQGDARSTTLRLAHTAVDALTGTALLLVWQRSHGLAEAGFLAVLLRVLGFVPTLIYGAWAQVLLVKDMKGPLSVLWVGLGGAAMTALMGLIGALAVQQQWLAPSWAGLLPYLPPLVLWQGGACLLAACSHLPYQRGRSESFSYVAMGFDAMQLLVLCLPVLAGWTLDSSTHVWWLSGASAIGLLAMSWWLKTPGACANR